VSNVTLRIVAQIGKGITSKQWKRSSTGRKRREVKSQKVE
jgi:hypothetical protein